MKGWQAWRKEEMRPTGGINEVDADDDLKPGRPRSASNYECSPAGLPRRMDGYERYNGRGVGAVPGIYAAPYFILPFTNGTTGLVVGASVQDNISAAGPFRVAQVTVTSGTLGAGTGAGTVLLLQGTASSFSIWTPGDAIGIAGVGTVVGLAGAGTQGTALPPWGVAAAGFVIDANYKTNKRACETFDRLAVGGPAGSGGITGLFVHNSAVFACRADAVTPSQLNIWTTDGSVLGGWLKSPMQYEVQFTAGSVPPAIGAVIGKGAVSAQVLSISLESGDWTLGTAAGRFVTAVASGGHFSAGAFTSGTTATCSGAEVQVSLIAGGRQEAVIHNFYGATNLKRAYVVDGVNKGFEFDPAIGPMPIRTGMGVDTPNHVEAHRDYLFFSYPGGSVQNAGVGNPHGWTVRTGADEFGLGDDVSGMKSLRSGILAVAGKTSVKLLYGTNSSTWDLRPWLDKQGAVPYCLAEISQQGFALDYKGAYFISPTQTFGDVEPLQLTRDVHDTINAKAINAVGIVYLRGKGMVYIFFNDKTGLAGTFVGEKLVGWMPFTLAHQFTCFAVGPINNVERVFAGTDTGLVMELNVGGSFDGTAIASSIQFVESAQGTARNKRYHKSEFDITSTHDLAFTLALGFDGGRDPSQEQEISTAIGASRQALAEFRIEGEATSISQTLSHSDDIEPSFTLQRGRLFYTVRGIRR